MTERKDERITQLERELAEVRAQLAESHESEERLREQQRRKHHAEKMEALGRLASGVAHDFNNLLTPIVTYLELARAGGPVDESLLETALYSTQRATTLIARILRYGHPEEGHREEVNLAKLCADAVELTRTAFAGRVKLELSVPDALPPLIADAAQLHQALMSLCINAGQAVETRRGSVQVEVALANDPEPCFEIHVRDDGPGIEEPILRRIFDPFFSTRAPEEGSGMGLFIAQGVARAHDGQLNVTCPADGGACFTLRLPRSKRTPMLPAAPPPPTAFAASDRGMRVLAVDDEAGVLQVVELALSMAGHTVACFDNATLSLEVFNSDPSAYDAAVLDQNLGDGTGLELAAHMRRENQNMHIVLVSGRPSEELRRTAERLRVRMLAKPFSVESLQASLTPFGLVMK